MKPLSFASVFIFLGQQHKKDNFLACDNEEPQLKIKFSLTLDVYQLTDLVPNNFDGFYA